MNIEVNWFSRRGWHWVGWGWPLIGMLMVVTAAIGAYGTVSLYDSEEQVRRSHEVYMGLERLLALARDAETGQRGYVITGREEYLEPYREATPRIDHQLDALQSLLTGETVQEQRLVQLRTLLGEKRRELSDVIDLRRMQGFEPAQRRISNNTGKAFMDRARAIVAEMERDAAAQLAARQAVARRTRDQAVAIGLASGVLTVLICLSFGYFARRMLRQAARLTTSLFEQKELLEVTLSSIGDGVIAIDLDGRTTFCNGVAHALTACGSEETLGRPVDEILRLHRSIDGSKADNPGVVAIRERRAVDYSNGTVLVGCDGRRTHIDANAAPTFDSQGRLVGAVLVLHDVTERVRAEERFRVAVEAAPNAMIMSDPQGTMTLVNTRAETLFGYERDELLGNSIGILFHEKDRHGYMRTLAAIFANPSARPNALGEELCGLHRDGSHFPIEVGLNPIETSEGVFVLSSIADITDRKRSERALRERTEELARSNRDLEQFAYVASHDLQEPLRAVAGPLQLLQRRYEGKLDARADEFIGHAVDGAMRMQSLIDDLLSYSRVGRAEDPRQFVQLGQALELALKNLALVVQETQAQVTHDPLPTVQGVATQLGLLFQNLISNAIKFRKKDQPVLIHVGAQSDAGAWRISVSDNGIGVAEQYFERIFVIFQRLHTRREYPGTGLGLALCKRIVEHHGGNIWVESKPPEGTTFFFTLPRAPGEGSG